MTAITLTPDQIHAKYTLLSGLKTNKMALLTGYAGTGKTTLTMTMAQEFSKIFGQISIATPTHKAAAVCRQVQKDFGVSFETGTIHSLLGIGIRQTLDGKTKLLPPSKAVSGLLIVDEASMIDSELYDHIINYAEKVLFVGDVAQLPPINSEVSPVFERVQIRAHLNNIMRQAADSPIIQLATWLRNKIEANQKINIPELISQCAQVDPEETKIGTDRVNNIAAIVASAKAEGMDARMIGYTNAETSKSGMDIKKAINNGSSSLFGPGDPVYYATPKMAWSDHKGKIEIENNTEAFVLNASEQAICPKSGLLYQDLLLSNSDTWIRVPVQIAEYRKMIKKLQEEYAVINLKSKFAADPALVAELKKANSEMSHFLPNNFSDLRINHALTIHKSQGSTFDVVVLNLRDIFKMREHLLRALYVAITRPSKYLVLCY